MTASSATTEEGWDSETARSDPQTGCSSSQGGRQQSPTRPRSPAPARGLIPDDGVPEDKERAQKRTCLFYGLEKKPHEGANDLFLPSLQEGWGNLDFTRTPSG